MKKQVILIGFLAISLLGFAQKKYYVKIDGSPSLAGTSWSWASNNIQAIVDRASAGDTVYVGVGTYYGGFRMKEGVSVKGGYTANNANPTERYDVLTQTDPAKQTILDGGGTQRVITQFAPFAIPTVWEGLVIQNGKPAVELNVGSIIYYGNRSNQIAGVLYKYNAETGQGMLFGREEIQKQWGGYNNNYISSIADIVLPEIISPEEAKADLNGSGNSITLLTLFGETSADFLDKEDGKSNNYAAYWCSTLTVDEYDHWYLPSAGELQEVYDSGIMPVLKNIGKDILHGYWTSTNLSPTMAWTYFFGKEYVHPALKYNAYTVSGVHSFVRPTDTDSIFSAGGGVFLAKEGGLKNCIVKNNQSSSRGGGVYVGNGGTLTNCVVEGNQAPEGKEVYYEWTLGIATVPAEALQVQIYPNPVKNGENIQVALNAATISEVKYQWVNTSGKTVSTGTLHSGENTLKTPTQSGLYLLILTAGDKQYQTKIIIK
ncbi:hypothetical protein AGMMS50262_04780 [Bacteroidia bacterium]|nr:hypothetical protein AGMMS50262_04780 [Bacteroidia bacterium]